MNGIVIYSISDDFYFSKPNIIFSVYYTCWKLRGKRFSCRSVNVEKPRGTTFKDSIKPIVHMVRLQNWFIILMPHMLGSEAGDVTKRGKRHGLDPEASRFPVVQPFKITLKLQDQWLL